VQSLAPSAGGLDEAKPKLVVALQPEEAEEGEEESNEPSPSRDEG
jgi:hypothetical protein